MRTKVEIIIENISEHFNCCTPKSLKIIERAFRKCSVIGCSWNGFESEIARKFGISLGEGTRAIPASVLAPSELQRSTATGIMRVEPIHLRADPSRVTLIEGARLDIQQEEAEAIVRTLNEFFSDENITFYRGADSHRWYVEGAPQASVGERSPSELHGSRLEPSLAEIQKSGVLKRIATEIQMILHDHETNSLRAAKGMAEINSLWFFGAGEPLGECLPEVEKILTNSSIALNSAKFANIKSAYVSDGSDIDRVLLDEDAEDCAIICDSPKVKNLQVSFDSVAIEALIRLIELLHRGDISCFEVWSASGRWSIGQWDRWCFWRNSFSLKERS